MIKMNFNVLRNQLMKMVSFMELFYKMLTPTNSEQIISTLQVISGSARFLAVSELEHKTIPARILPFDCPNPHEIALHENLRRNNLAWYDQVELERELHEFRISQHGEEESGRPVIGKSPAGHRMIQLENLVLLLEHSVKIWL